jgi:hypothetical protein
MLETAISQSFGIGPEDGARKASTLMGIGPASKGWRAVSRTGCSRVARRRSLNWPAVEEKAEA